MKRLFACTRKVGGWSSDKFVVRAFAASFVLLLCPGCSKFHRADTKPLDNVGVSYDAIKRLRALEVTDAEVAELAKVKAAGISDSGAVELLRIARSQRQPFTAGADVAQLLQSGLSDESVLELVRLRQLGLGSGELGAIRLTGMSDSVVLAVARRRSQGKATPSGASLAKLRDAGIHDAELTELVRLGITDSDVRRILEFRHRHWTQGQIIQHYRAGAK